MNTLLQAVILSLLPVSELRGGIPWGLAHNHPLLVVVVLCVLANLLVIPLVFLFLHSLHRLLYPLKPYRYLFERVVRRTQKKAFHKFERYEYWALFLFVAIPLPITGAYTGTLAAWLLGVNKLKAFWFLSLGVVAAGIVVTLVAVFGISMFEVFLKT